MAVPQAAQELQGALRLLLVPQINQVQLIVGLALQELSLAARAQHLSHAFEAVTAGQEQHPAQHAERGGRDVGVVVIQADAEVGIVQGRVEREGLFEGVLDAFAVAGRG